MLGAISAQIFSDFQKVLRDFLRILEDFARILWDVAGFWPNQTFRGCGCTPASYTSGFIELNTKQVSFLQLVKKLF